MFKDSWNNGHGPPMNVMRRAHNKPWKKSTSCLVLSYKPNKLSEQNRHLILQSILHNNLWRNWILCCIFSHSVKLPQASNNFVESSKGLLARSKPAKTHQNLREKWWNFWVQNWVQFEPGCVKGAGWRKKACKLKKPTGLCFHGGPSRGRTLDLLIKR